MKLLFRAFLILTTAMTYAQFSGNNLGEYQNGKLPNDTEGIESFYDRFVVNYNKNNFKVSSTIEQFNTPTEGSSYVNLSQLSFQYKNKPFEVKLGNFYETIGRGTLLRSFEVPGSILQDISYRSRQYFNRDVLGALAKYSYKNLKFKLIYGNPLNYVFPPVPEFTKGFNNLKSVFGKSELANQQRRSDNILALNSEYSIKQHTIGLAVMKHNSNSVENEYAMLSGSGNISSSISYFTEISKEVSKNKLTDFSDNASFALYGGFNFYLNSFGASLEFKNYKNFLIGSGINEPPALVKEHTYKTLNRSTHVLIPTNETGYQFEAFYSFKDYSTLTFNNTLAQNDFGIIYSFIEYFLEYDFSPTEKMDLKLFVDYANDPLKLQENRISTGVYSNIKIFNKRSFITEYEYQNFTREFKNYVNHALTVGYTHTSKLVINLVTEFSNDPDVINGKTTVGKIGSKKFNIIGKFWTGTNIKYQINRKNTIQLFAGKRRGGPACNAGVCYEVPDFEGLEIRLTTRF